MWLNAYNLSIRLFSIINTEVTFSTLLHLTARLMSKGWIFQNRESQPPWISYEEQQLQSHMDIRQKKMLTCWRGGKKLENNIPFADNQNSGWPAVSNLSLAPSPRMCRLWYTVLTHKQPTEKSTTVAGTPLLPQGCNQTTLPPKSAAACRLVLQSGARLDQARGSERGTLLWKVSVSTVHSDRKRWLMSLRPLPAVKRHPGMLKWPLWSFLFLAGSGGGAVIISCDEFVNSCRKQ